MFHGLNDNCTNNINLKEIVQRVTGAPAICIEIGTGVETTWNTVFTHQAQEACEKVIAHSLLSTAPEINVIGFSQGGLLARYITQGCDISGKVRNLVTVGTPNMGLVEAPRC